MTITIPYTLVVIVCTLVGAYLLWVLVSLFVFFRMDTSYTDQIKHAWRERRRRRKS